MASASIVGEKGSRMLHSSDKGPRDGQEPEEIPDGTSLADTEAELTDLQEGLLETND